MNHVIPLNDPPGHDTESIYCECRPEVDWDNDLVIHHAWDHREVVEEAELIVAGTE